MAIDTDACHMVLAALKKGQSNLSYPRSAIKGALELIIGQLGGEWKLKKEHFADFVTTMERRIMNVARHVQQRDSKKGAKHGWVARLPWNAGSDIAAAERPKKKRNMVITYWYGFAPDVLKPWRSNTEGGPQEAGEVKPHGDQDGRSPIVGVWADGSEHEISDMTVDGYEAAL